MCQCVNVLMCQCANVMMDNANIATLFIVTLSHCHIATLFISTLFIVLSFHQSHF